ncbi:DUF3300 domain-containing protein [Variovorax sp. YR216]|uniref:DUF3300 domain-containing protein n=1 Tax=Variovorax sp. YR216 TaxID=1882828 RepID=UPI000896ADD8|nr:DUF3300 domain-containing protein [Variovorax sp. YR216]SEB16188.1 Protein of unknown function [Variovorax sp. YR216]
MRFLSSRFARILVLMLALLSSTVMSQPSQPFSREQLDQMMAPIALYPDSLLSQVLMASTYPADVADAAKWSKANSNQKGDAAVKAVQDKPWDPSVQSLVAFPQVLQMMGDQPDWVQNVGDAFLASSKDVLDSAQRLRTKAQQQGSLKTNEQQKVIVEQEPQTQQTVIKIEPANPEVVYVPSYNPAVVYGAWPYPAYPPYAYAPAPYWYPGAALATGIAFGVGVAAVGALWGNANWGGGNVNINANRYNSINTNRQISANQSFQHNAANRRGTPYRDQRSQQQFGRNVPGAENRADFRGRDNAGRDAQRQQAQSALQQRGMDPGQGRENLRNDPGTRDRAQRAAEGAGRGDRGGAGAGDRGGQLGDRGGAGGGDRGGQLGDRGGAGGGDRGAQVGNRGGAGTGDRGGQFGGGDRGGAGAGAGGRGGGGFEQVQQRGGDNALRGANSGQARQQMDRGAASRQSMSGGGGARASGGFSGGGARAGGGGGGGMRGGGGGGGGGRGGGRR